MNEQEKMYRLLRMLLLLAGGRRYTKKELMERFEITDRTVYRYFKTFEGAGFVIDRKNSTYRVLTNNDPARTLGKLFHFSEEEAFILCQVLEQAEGTAAVKDKLLHKLHALYDFKALAGISGDRSIENITVLRKAIDQKKRVLLQSYRSSNSQTIADREIEPFQFLPDYEAVWCFDPREKKNKQFKISRMGSVAILGKGWQHEALHSTPFVDAFRMSAPKPICKVKARLSLKALNLLREEFPLAGEYVREEKDGKYKLEIPIADFNGIGRFVLGLGEEVNVLGPIKFLAFLQKKVTFFMHDISCQ